MKYTDNARYMEGIIVEISDGAVSIDFKGRMGFLKIPMRMLITDYPLQVGQEVGLSMSYVEVLKEEPNEKYISNLSKKDKEV
ncbi:CBO2463/CBO2479 domain-containing protein [Tissierella sp. MB52-C2]|uniref:CBO2463/CBO2479 domain-containing protein n=1 Tax=Tissierella sp. MB52-C2 TaxID=3070999 RepID=UPI00280B0E0F|nr:CBO2463/CBO2479 domain-containing protein [Tissierella sp. MB52-C2]WMM24977.1 CBO2463/CBO2479 domain-containing protein [Tissierella sp. MB52-C2]